MKGKPPLTQHRVFWFWVPLAAMWLLMAVEHPIVAAIIARLPDPEPNLAIFGVTFSLSLIIEAPIIMLLTAGTALARGSRSYSMLLKFTHILAAGLTGLHLITALTPPLYGFIMGRLIGVPDEILESSRFTFLLMTPWTAAIAYRRLWQGVLIRFDRTRVVPLTILARLLTVTAILAVGLLTQRFRGADLGAVALSIGVIAAAVTAYAFVRPVVRRYLRDPSLSEESMTWGSLVRFYGPLALMPLIHMLGRPVLVMGLSRAAEPIASLAVWPVIMGVLFLGRSVALSYQEVVVALIDEKQSYEKLRRFAEGLALALTATFAIVALTPVAGLLYKHVSGLSPEMIRFAIVPTLILSIVPGLDTSISWLHGLLVYSKQTRPITGAVVINVLVLTMVMLAGVALFPMTQGTIIGALALTAATGAQWSYLQGARRRRGIQKVLIESKEGEPVDQSVPTVG